MATLQQAISKAKADPNSDYAVDLRSRIQSGSFDENIIDEGIELPFYKPTIDTAGERLQVGQREFKETGLEGIKEIGRGIKMVGQSLIPGGEEPAFGTTRGILKTVSGIGKAIEAPAAFLFGLAEPEIESAIAGLDDDTKQKIISAKQQFDKLPPEIQDVTGDLFDILNIIPFMGQAKALAVPTEQLLKKGAEEVVEKGVRHAPGLLAKTAETITDTTLKFTPTQVKKFTKVAGTGPGDFALKKGFTGNLDNMQGQGRLLASDSYDALNTAVAGVTDAFKNTRVDNALEALLDGAKGQVGLEEVAEKWTKLLGKSKKEGLTLTEILDVKRGMDSELHLFKRAGDVKESRAAQGLANVRQDIRKFIEDEGSKKGVANVRELSSDIQAGHEFADSLGNTIARQSKNNALSLTDAILFGGGGAIGLGIPGAIGIVLARRIATNPAARNAFAKGLLALDGPTQAAVLTGKKLTPTMINELRVKVNEAEIEAGVAQTDFETGGSIEQATELQEELRESL